MKSSLENTTVKDISRLINTACLQAPAASSLETLAEMLCTSDRYKVYLTDDSSRLCGVIQAKQIAMELLRLSKGGSEAEDMLPAQTFMLNSHQAAELAEEAPSVSLATRLGTVLELMDCNSIREVAVVDADGRLLGTLEAKHILAQYLHAKTEASL